MDDRITPDDEQTADALVLAAVRRAVLHRPRPSRGATLRDLQAHLGLARRSTRSTALRARLAALERDGLLETQSEHGVTVWALRDDGGRLLESVRARGQEPALGESPQHAAWRRARTVARRELGRMAADLSDSLQSCERLLARIEGAPTRAPSSDDWFALAERLRRDCRRVGSAWYCLREWQEPDEEQADLDDLQEPDDRAQGEALAAIRSRRAGRRNTRLWSRPA
jgi:hypothetical protein